MRKQSKMQITYFEVNEAQFYSVTQGNFIITSLVPVDLTTLPVLRGLIRQY